MTKENNYSHDGYVKIVYNKYYNKHEDFPNYSINTRTHVEEPLLRFRWLVKKSGEKVLQQAFNVTEDLLKPSTVEWHDIETIFEKEIID